MILDRKLITVRASAARDKTADGGGFRTNFISFRTSPMITTSTATNGLAFFFYAAAKRKCAELEFQRNTCRIVNPKIL